MKIRNAYNYDVQQESVVTGLKCLLPTRAVQSQKEDADINTIVRRFGITGKVPVNVRPPMVGDFTDAVDYQSSLNAIMEAEKSFMKLQSETRARFDNNPQLFMEFCLDSRNLEEMRKMGLAVPKPEVAASAV